jgi:allophanate hydrolase
MPSLEIPTLRRAFLAGETTVGRLIETVLDRVARWDDPALWINRVEDRAVLARAGELDALAAADPEAVARLPLFGIPFAVKDNIDVAGMPTTAGCPAFAYTPDKTAPVVSRLLDAGAVLVGKTNLDQFATGLVGARSPYGTPRNAIDARFIPGGSSSGSAVAVAAGLVSFALGTDTAGSGRVPAACNNIVGLKPSRGLLSTGGVVPACRSLDCVSIMALTPADAGAVFDAAGAFDPDDPFSRRQPAPARGLGSSGRLGVPRPADLDFFGDEDRAQLFGRIVTAVEAAGCAMIAVDFAPFREAGKLLYEGPWVAERLEAAGELLDRDPDAMLPVTRSIIAGGRDYTALDAYRGQYRLAELRRQVDRVFTEIDALLLPTIGTIYTTESVRADPLRLNANLGRYTSFVNLLDLCAIALPAAFAADGLPFGVSLIAPAFADETLVALATWLSSPLKSSTPAGSASMTGSG